MTLQIPAVVPTRIDWRLFAIMGNAMPPRDPDEDEEDDGDQDDEEEDDEEDDEENRTDEPPVVREPDEG
jgi:hypothetical protein